MRSVTLEVGLLAFEALLGEDDPDASHVPGRMSGALRFYLGERDSGRPGWEYPELLRDRRPGAEAKLELRIDEERWREFEDEAERQGVSARQLAEHAAFYFAAELSAGRIGERIVSELERG